MKRYLVAFFASLLCLCMAAQTADIPDAPDRAPLVVDFAAVFDSTARVMNDSLISFADRTSIEIAVVSVKDLKGLDPVEYGTLLGRQWGLGDKEKNNGVVVIIKPKTDDSKGQVGIAVGYGLEGLLTDATCKRIIENEVIPFFKEGDYTGGAWSAINVIMPIVSGSYTQEQYISSLSSGTDSKSTTAEKKDYPWYYAVLGFFVFLFFMALMVYAIWDFLVMVASLFGFGSSTYSGGSYSGKYDDDRTTSRSYGSYSSSSSSSSHRSYGGGSFGGGGASGSW